MKYSFDRPDPDADQTAAIRRLMDSDKVHYFSGATPDDGRSGQRAAIQGIQNRNADRPQPLIWNLGTDVYFGDLSYKDAASILQANTDPSQGLTREMAVDRLRSVVSDMLGPNQRLIKNDPREYNEKDIKNYR